MFKRLDAYLSGTGIGRAAFSPVDVNFSRNTRVQPDVLVVPTIGGRAPLSWTEAERLLLVVEVRSPGTAKRDRGEKRRLYQRQGVPEYWLVDCDAESIERWRGGEEKSEVLTDRITWEPQGANAPLEIELGEFFAGLTRA
jgi:Uma2 family endonuclease